MTAPYALLLFLLSASGRAETVSFDAGPAQDSIYSADGYHVARLEKTEDGDRWLVDGRLRARGAAGSFPPGGVLSEDGAQLLHLMRAADAQGNPIGVAVALNGRRVGAPYEEIRSLVLSPGARNAAYVAKTASGWSVVSAQGVGPAFPEAPTALFVSDNATAYFAEWQGATLLYRDHKPVRRMDGSEANFNSDLRRFGAVIRDRDAGKVFVEIDGERFGPFKKAKAPVFSRNGRHWAALADDGILKDGVLGPAAPRWDSNLSVDDVGRVFQDVLLVSLDDHLQIHTCYLDGKELRNRGRPPRVGFLAGGAHYVYPMLTSRGVAVGLDGRDLEFGVPLPLPGTPVEFDGVEEFHYWSLEGKNLRLVCGSLDGKDPKLTRCAAKSRGRFAQAK